MILTSRISFHPVFCFSLLRAESRAIALVIIAIIIVGVIIAKQNKQTSNPVTNREPIKIGYIGPMTGALAAGNGQSVMEAIRLAHGDKNMIADRKVEVIYEDDACDPKKAVSAMNKLVSVDHIKLVLTFCSGSTLAIAPIAEQNKIVVLSAVAATPKLTTAGDYIFRISGSSERIASTVVPTIKQRGYKKVRLFLRIMIIL